MTLPSAIEGRREPPDGRPRPAAPGRAAVPCGDAAGAWSSAPRRALGGSAMRGLVFLFSMPVGPTCSLQPESLTTEP